MLWIAPSEKDTATATLEKRLRDAADQFRANSGLKSQARMRCAPNLQKNLSRRRAFLRPLAEGTVHPMKSPKQRSKVRPIRPNQGNVPIQ
jgi:hypothetical protein